MALKMRGKYVVEIAPGTAGTADKPAVGPEYRNKLAEKGFSKFDETSLADAFARSVAAHPDKPCLGRRRIDGKGPFVWATYKEVADDVAAIGSAMAFHGVKAHDRVGVYGVNSPEWMTVMQAGNRMTVYTVPLYDTLGKQAVEYVIQHSEAKIVFVSANNFGALTTALPAVKDQVKTVVVWGETVFTEEASQLGINVYSFKEFLEIGKTHLVDPVLPTLDDLCTLMYTSGTTGTPKGVMITHRIVLACVAAQKEYIEQAPGLGGLTSDDVFLSYLPLAHIMDRAAEEMFLATGGRIGYFGGDVKKLVDDIAELKPTVFIGVPRVFDRIYSGVTGQVKAAGGLKAFLFNWGYSRKLAALNRGVEYSKASPFFDRLVFSKIKARLGGRVRICISGGAPLAPHVEDFLRVTMCCFVAQGYGLTESCAASFIGSSEADTAGSVGVPLPSHSLRLEAIPELKYDPLSEPPRGEVCLKGPIIFKGYYKAEDLTKEVLDADGWFHTGDVGEVLPSGALKIIDRKKQIFKLSQGEYVAVEKVEAAYKKVSLIEQIWVYGSSLENVLVAVVIPAEEPFVAWAKKLGLSGNFQQLVKDPKAKEALLKEMNPVAKEAGLKGFEMVRGLILDSELFSVENDLLTPTFKVKRKQAQDKYQSQITALYAEINATQR